MANAFDQFDAPIVRKDMATDAAAEAEALRLADAGERVAIRGPARGAPNPFDQFEAGAPAAPPQQPTPPPLNVYQQRMMGTSVHPRAQPMRPDMSEMPYELGGRVTDWTGSPVLGAMTAGGLALLPIPPGASAARGAVRASAATGEADRLRDLVRPSFGEGRLAPPPLDPRAAPRVQAMEGLPVPIREATQGQLTRDPVRLRNETQLSQTKAGAPLRDVYTDQNSKLLENLDVLTGRTGTRATDEIGVGRRVAGAVEKGRPGAEGALTQARNAAEKNVSQLYKKAEKTGEMEDAIDIKPLLNHIRAHDNPDTINYIVKKLQALKLVKEDELFGGTLRQARDITLNQLEEVRKAAATTARTSSDGTARHYASQVVRTIDEMIPDTAGGEAYRAARAARREFANKFDEPKAIAQLTGNKTRTDRVTALEDVWDKTVVQGSISDLTRVRDTLLNVPDRRLRDAGRKAWRDIAGETVRYIKESATKSAAMDELSNPNLAPQALKNVLDKIGDDKLRVIFGDSSAQKLRSIAQVAADLKTKPPARLAGSDTAVNFMNMPWWEKLDEVLTKIPVLGGGTQMVKGGLRMGAAAMREGRAAGEVREALKRPTAPPPL